MDTPPTRKQQQKQKQKNRKPTPKCMLVEGRKEGKLPFFVCVCVCVCVCVSLMCVCCMLSCSVVSNCSQPPWTVTHHAPLSMGILQGKNTEMGYHALLQESNPGLPHCRWFSSVWATKLEGGREITLFLVCVCFSCV